MPDLSTPNSSLLLSYLDLRKAIGIIGISLPFVLVAGKVVLTGPGIESSISSYYYTVMRDVFVGSLCAIAVFLMSYKGYERKDLIAGKLAAVFSLGTALLPTNPASGASAVQMDIGKLHLLFAASFFLTLSYFALVLFRKTNPNKLPTPRKQLRNIIYTVCGGVMISCILIAAYVQMLPQSAPIFAYKPIFWLEAIAIVFFGISWFVKGEAILKDEVETK